ncbi:MAG: carboxypeptidase-like regulatory domain-containing protein [Candidatus Solibacter sp.]
MKALVTYLILLTSVAWGADLAELRGRICDPAGAALPHATIKLIREGAGFSAFRVSSDDAGRFHIENMPVGQYFVRAGAIGFLERALPGFELRADEFRDAGEIRLKLAGCDAPGMICDSFGAARAPDDTVARMFATVEPGFGLNLETVRVIHAGGSSKDADVVVSRESGSRVIAPVNGALLSACASPPAKLALRLDGWGRENRVCVQTARRYQSVVFLTDEVLPDSMSLRLWVVTRK